jgi:hypothetical protein
MAMKTMLACALVPALAGAAIPAAAHDGPHTGGSGARAGSSEVSITVSGGLRIIEANGIPDHAAGRFPNAANPNSIRTQRYRFQVPAEPRLAATATPYQVHGLFGIAVNGVVFDPGTAEFWNNDRNWQYDALTGGMDLGLDINHAHVQPNGAYHYHGIPTGLLDSLGRNSMALVGYAADGFPIYGPEAYREPQDPGSGLAGMRSSYRIKSGTRPGGPGGRYDGRFVQDWEFVDGAGDLDACNGRAGVTPEYPDGTYYYVLTAEFPFVPRCWRGTPDPSFRKQGGPGGPGGMRPPPGGRPPPGMPPPPRRAPPE